LPSPRLCEFVALNLDCASAQAFTGAAFEEDVVRNDDRGAAVLLQDGGDVLEQVELFVTGAGLEIVATDDDRLFLFVAVAPSGGEVVADLLRWNQLILTHASAAQEHVGRFCGKDHAPKRA
jgi:hypothetical protein